MPQPALDFPELYRRYGGAVYARCYLILNNRAAAEDATQETFLRVYRHLKRTTDAENALRWIYKVATNYCLNELRNQQTRSGGVQAMMFFGDARQVPRVEERLSDRDLGRRLAAVAPAAAGTAAWLYLVDGMDQAEVARVLGISRRTVINYVSMFIENARKFAMRSTA
ncbi:MAG: hypothetical protein RJA70_4628 [Pseudomonadota bacterium]|jgi:RNA polymerase sigma-70 factor (ECF subfamily)